MQMINKCISLLPISFLKDQAGKRLSLVTTWKLSYAYFVHQVSQLVIHKFSYLKRISQQLLKFFQKY